MRALLAVSEAYSLRSPFGMADTSAEQEALQRKARLKALRVKKDAQVSFGTVCFISNWSPPICLAIIRPMKVQKIHLKSEYFFK